MSPRQIGENLMANARAGLHRQLVVLSGSMTWAERVAFELIGSNKAVALTTRSPVPDRWLSPQAARKTLGSEIDGAIFDTHSAIDADAVGIVSGAVRAGGLVCFLKPARAEQPDLSTYYSRRFWRLLEQQRDAVQIVEGKPLPAASKAPAPDRKAAAITTQDNALPATDDQEKAIQAVVGVVEGQRRRPALLIADRGRGKSAALGIAAGRLLIRDPAAIVVTGSSRTAAAAVFRHAFAVCPARAQSLLWKDVDTLLVDTVPCQLLLIDEAATLPLHILEKLLGRYPRVAMATTVHGYEGSGRGFLTRFDVILDKQTRGYRKVELATPVRWALDDPVERSINQLLVLDATLPELPAAATISSHQTAVTRVDRAQLAESESMVRELFSLLVLSHYKTRPNDLQTMLDAPRLRIYRLSTDETVIGQTAGVALVMDEGGLERSLGEDIAKGLRRPPGQVLPELLAIHGQPDAVTQKMQRIMRVVIHPAVQRRGLGSRLVSHIVGDSDAPPLTGSNFALSASLLGFWQRNGFSLVQISQRRTVQSGRHSGTILRGETVPASALTERMVESLVTNLSLLLATSLSDLEPATICGVVGGLDRYLPGPSPRTLREVADVAYGSRDPQNVPASLSTAALHGLANGVFQEPQIVIQRVLQQRSWNDCDCIAGEIGWRAGNNMIRAAFREYLAWANPTDPAA